MSINNCALFVDGNGRYCCSRKHICVDNCAYTLTVANTTVDLLLAPTGDPADGTIVAATLEEGVHTIWQPGNYFVDVDCEAWEAASVPLDPEMHAMICCEKLKLDDGDSLFDVLMFEKMCQIAEALEEPPEPVGIENSAVKVGCTLDASGAATGTVFLCKTVDEATGDVSIVPMAYLYDGTLVNPYGGEWGLCDPSCPPSPPLGLITDLALLES